jgi:hypothetical protein
MTTASVATMSMVVAGGPLLLLAAWWHGRVMRGVRPGILAFEFAGSGSRMFDLLVAWGPSGRERARRALAVDHLVIVGYVLLLVGLSLVSVEVMRGAGQGAWAATGVLLGVAAALLTGMAGLADVVENRALLRCLRAWRDAPGDADTPARQAVRREVIAALTAPAAAASRAARLKFVLLGVVAVWLLVTLTVHLALR